MDDQSEWSEACCRSFHTTRETKLQSLQYKILNRVIPCRVFMKRLRITTSDECQFCPTKDSIAHFLFTCDLVRPFWRGVCSWFYFADDLYLDQLSIKEFVFGLPKTHHRSSIINTILMNICFYIQRQKLFHNGQLDLLHWLRELRNKLRVEKWICSRTGKLGQFNKWNRILKELG